MFYWNDFQATDDPLTIAPASILATDADGDTITYSMEADTGKPKLCIICYAKFWIINAEMNKNCVKYN